MIEFEISEIIVYNGNNEFAGGQHLYINQLIYYSIR